MQILNLNPAFTPLGKDPITDHKKKSHKGLISLVRNASGEYHTLDQCTPEQEAKGLLVPMYRDGTVLVKYGYEDIRARVAEALTQYPLDVERAIGEARKDIPRFS